jgi:putative Holliday junction resolvase
MLATNVYVALDIGKVRIGVASNPSGVFIAQPRGVIANDQNVVASIKKLISDEQATVLVVGLPRGLQGQETEQTKYVRDFIQKLQDAISVPIQLQDEAMTSVHAEEELSLRKKPFEKGDIDALAATYILQDYLQSLPESVSHE